MTEQNTSPTEEPEPPGRHEIEALARRAFEAAVEDIGHRARSIPRPVLLEILSRIVGQVAGLLLDDHDHLTQAYARALAAWDSEGKFAFKFGFRTTLQPMQLGKRFEIKTELGWSVAEKDATVSMTRDPEQPELFEEPVDRALNTVADIGSTLKEGESLTIASAHGSATITPETGRKAKAALAGRRAHTLQAAE